MKYSSIFQYTATEKIVCRKPVDRLAFLSGLCVNKVVLDLGALDETAYASKSHSDRWLHRRISEVAEDVLGIDNSALISVEGLRTSSNSIIVKADIFNLRPLLVELNMPEPGIVVAGELIEHLDNPLEFLKSLKALGIKRIAISTPNACNIHNFLIGLSSRESMHKDHISIYSIKSLSTLIRQAGFTSFEVIPYHAEFPEIIGSAKGLKKVALISFQRVVNFFENRFPILSGGLIAVIDLPTDIHN